MMHEEVFESYFSNDLNVVPSIQFITEPCDLHPTGDRTEISWPLDNANHPGPISSSHGDGQLNVSYDCGGVKILELGFEIWRPCDTLAFGLAGFLSIQSNKLQVLRQMLDTMGQKPFLALLWTVFPQYVLLNSYEVEELELKNLVRCIPISVVSSDFNVDLSHTVYRLKVLEDEPLVLKACITLLEMNSSAIFVHTVPCAPL